MTPFSGSRSRHSEYSGGIWPETELNNTLGEQHWPAKCQKHLAMEKKPTLQWYLCMKGEMLSTGVGG